METELPGCPWSEVGIDVFIFKQELHLIIVDYYSKWIEAVPIAMQTAGAIVTQLKELFARLGVPKVVQSDNGGCFVGSLFKQFAADWGFRHVASSPRYPQSDGAAERAVKTVIGLWRKGDDRLSALLAYRTTPLGSGYSPAELMFGRVVRSKSGSAKTDSEEPELEDDPSLTLLFSDLESEGVEGVNENPNAESAGREGEPLVADTQSDVADGLSSGSTAVSQPTQSNNAPEVEKRTSSGRLVKKPIKFGDFVT